MEMICMCVISHKPYGSEDNNKKNLAQKNRARNTRDNIHREGETMKDG